MSKSKLQFDDINHWSEIKLEIIEKYAGAYSKILSSSNWSYIHHSYVDAFSGPGHARSRTTHAFIPGSPIRALGVQPPFERYYFIDLDESKADALNSAVERALAEMSDPKPSVTVLVGDCNRILLDEVFPTLAYENFQRALCVLDPYGLHLDWQVIEAAGKLGSVEIFLNFPVMDMNRNTLWSNPDDVSQADRDRMSAFWGDDSWREAAYEPELTLFGDRPRKLPNEKVVEAFRQRLRTRAGFKYVPQPIPMRNSKNATLYYLFFAGPNPAGLRIAEDIFDRYRDRLS